MRLLIIAVLCIAILVSGCSMTGYDTRPVEHNDFISELHTVFEGKKFTTRISHPYYTGETTWKLSETRTDHKKWVRIATVSNAEYEVEGVEFRVNASDTIVGIKVPDGTVPKRIENEPQNMPQPDAAANSDNRTTDEEVKFLAEFMVNKQLATERHQFEKQLREQQIASRIAYEEELLKLRNYADAADDFDNALGQFWNYTRGSKWTLDMWIKTWITTYHSSITQRKEFFREFIMFSAQNAPTAELFLHYREIAGYFNIRFTLTEVYLREYPNQAELPGGNIVEPNKAGIRAHLGNPDEETELSLVYEDFRFVFDTEGNLQNAELR